jgi:hypothetical protein
MSADVRKCPSTGSRLRASTAESPVFIGDSGSKASGGTFRQHVVRGVCSCGWGQRDALGGRYGRRPLRCDGGGDRVASVQRSSTRRVALVDSAQQDGQASVRFHRAWEPASRRARDQRLVIRARHPVVRRDRDRRPIARSQVGTDAHHVLPATAAAGSRLTLLDARGTSDRLRADPWTAARCGVQRWDQGARTTAMSPTHSSATWGRAGRMRSSAEACFRALCGCAHRSALSTARRRRQVSTLGPGNTPATGERGFGVVGSAAAKLGRLDELDGVAIRVLEPR